MAELITVDDIYNRDFRYHLFQLGGVVLTLCHKMFIESQPTHRKPSRVQTNWSRAVAVFLFDTLSKYGLRAALRAADRTNDSPSFRLERLRRASSTLAPMDRCANRVSARVPIVNKTNVSGVFYPNEVIAILPLVTGSQWV